jgi:hypothetical protein
MDDRLIVAWSKLKLFVIHLVDAWDGLRSAGPQITECQAMVQYLNHQSLKEFG